MKGITKKELLQAIEAVPEDTEIWILRDPRIRFAAGEADPVATVTTAPSWAGMAEKEEGQTLGRTIILLTKKAGTP